MDVPFDGPQRSIETRYTMTGMGDSLDFAKSASCAERTHWGAQAAPAAKGSYVPLR
jgi:hypothetical protein